ncbi:MAG TPA: hypothetical protein VFU43_09445 [Streptosporangiaceae bacterium]|nr:hypothetical protein [Streptosporangiaceae bacterium]
MTANSTRDLARSVGRLSLLAALAGSGAYTIVYIYRWEWQRALIAAVMFLAALLIALTLVILDRLSRLERRLEGIGAGNLAGTAYGRSPASLGGNPLDHDFPWLHVADAKAETHVFIPILLSAGLLMSLVAALVERTAAFAGVGPPRTAAPASLTGTANRREKFRVRARTIVLAVAVGMAVGASVHLLRGALMFTPEPQVPGSRVMVIDVSTRGDPVTPPAEPVAVMAAFCRTTTHSHIAIDRVETLSPRRARLVVSPLLRPIAQRRYEGCLQDARLDYQLLDVVEVRSFPAAR